MYEGNCLKCGCRCFGWALRYQKYQSCPKCGAPMKIKDGDKV